MKELMWKTKVKWCLLRIAFQVTDKLACAFNFMWEHKILKSFSRGMTLILVDIEKSIIQQKLKIFKKIW